MSTPSKPHVRQDKCKPKLLYFIGVDWFFYSHFLDRAIAAKEAGYDVVVLTGITRQDSPLTQHGIKLIGISFERRSMNPMGLLRNLVDVVRVLKQEKPDIVHQIALKPILIGSVACRCLGIKRVISAVVGLGFAFSSERSAARVVKRILSVLFRVVLDKKTAKTVFENKDDRDYFIDQGWTRPENAVLIRGAGVDIDRFKPRADAQTPKTQNDHSENVRSVSARNQRNEIDSSLSSKTGIMPEPPIVMLLSRMLWDKGIGEFVEAARQLRRNHGEQTTRFVLVGDPDLDNRGAITKAQLQTWQTEGVIEWWGFRPDVENVLSQATVSCLPSYREGLPKSLLESLAMGLPCVATDVPGCREAVEDGVNGLLVPARDSVALANAIDCLVNNDVLRDRFGKASRQMAVEQFSKAIVNEQTLALYDQMSESND